MPGTSINISFATFLEGWLVRQQHYFDELLMMQQVCNDSREEDIIALITRVLVHYQEYYEHKSREAHRNVFLVFSPTWFTPFEKTFLWIAGFKPSLAFQLVTNSVEDLNENQNLRMNQLVYETKQEEKRLADELARIQESVAAPPIVDLARLEGGGPPVEGETQDVDTVIGMLRAAMEAVLADADSLRTRTADGVVEILNPVQNVRFMAAATQLQLRIRELGLQREDLAVQQMMDGRGRAEHGQV